MRRGNGTAIAWRLHAVQAISRLKYNGMGCTSMTYRSSNGHGDTQQVVRVNARPRQAATSLRSLLGNVASQVASSLPAAQVNSQLNLARGTGVVWRSYYYAGLSRIALREDSDQGSEVGRPHHPNPLLPPSPGEEGAVSAESV